MACDICKQNPPGKWHTTTTTTKGERAVTVACSRCYRDPRQPSLVDRALGALVEITSSSREPSIDRIRAAESLLTYVERNGSR